MSSTMSFDHPIKAFLSIYQVQEEITNTKPATIYVQELSSTSLKFKSDLKFPLSEAVVYKVSVSVFDNKMELYGNILTSVNIIEKNIYVYQFDYILGENSTLPNLYDLSYKKNCLENYDQNRVKKIY
ncbi:hypothetical protein [Alkalihalobacillus sp. LMS39]|uniref:hypothetical protein n=1 Tax=Alkalihalobacillus sp. LMS39 TaxID=2924032 RepID=UPI001FB1E545|nr:hypothetical protein [Alkalihalobacillus sp. LMS39]UOE95597.1 hypothetical protein MM271_08320 [Alkalihalobacillus sp. LMS39]